MCSVAEAVKNIEANIDSTALWPCSTAEQAKKTEEEDEAKPYGECKVDSQEVQNWLDGGRRAKIHFSMGFDPENAKAKATVEQRKKDFGDDPQKWEPQAQHCDIWRGEFAPPPTPSAGDPRRYISFLDADIPGGVPQTVLRTVDGP